MTYNTRCDRLYREKQRRIELQRQLDAITAERDEAVEALRQTLAILKHGLFLSERADGVYPKMQTLLDTYHELTSHSLDLATLVAEHSAEETAQETALSSVVPECCRDCRWGLTGSLSCDKFPRRPVGLFCGAWRDVDGADVVSEEEEEG